MGLVTIAAVKRGPELHGSRTRQAGTFNTGQNGGYHRNNSIQKMGVRNTAGLIRVAVEKGLLG